MTYVVSDMLNHFDWEVKETHVAHFLVWWKGLLEA